MTVLQITSQNAIVGCLLGTAVGDAVGLPSEGLSKRRQQALFGVITGPRLLGRRGMVSDDTEHACMLAQALIVSAGEIESFTRELARRMRFWLLAGPAGVGLATLRAILRLWIGIPPVRCGVVSAGNGPAMRSALLGVCCGDDLLRLRTLVRASTRLTHTDPRAEFGALAVAVAAYVASRSAGRQVHPSDFRDVLAEALGDSGGDLLELADSAAKSVIVGQTTQEFAATLGLREYVTGYMYHTAPVALHAWLSSTTDYRAAVLNVIQCGGDTDTTAAITGAIVGASVGKEGIPLEWRTALCEWPRTLDWMERLGAQLAESWTNCQPMRPLAFSFPAIWMRNVFFTTVILFHGFRRLLPPY